MRRISIAHIVYRFAIGGLENGVVNLVNNLPAQRFRHMIISLTEVTDLANRVQNPEVTFHALGKREGLNPGVYFRLWRLLRQLRPDIVHTRNLGTLDCQLPALLAGVRCRIHGEHGRDVRDLERTNLRHLLVRRAFRPLVGRYVSLSMDIDSWLKNEVGVPAQRVVQIYNGVDTDRFKPVSRNPGGGVFTIGTVGRLQGEKAPLTLIEAFAMLCSSRLPTKKMEIRLIMAGDGPLRSEVERKIKELGIESKVWLTGSRDDVAALMHDFDVFVLPSLTEGVSNTILEAMSSGLPVVATRVGGNPELVAEGQTGMLVAPADPDAMADAMAAYAGNPSLVAAHGAAARRRVLERFSLDAMVSGYQTLYEQAMGA